MSEKKGFIFQYGTAKQIRRLIQVSGPEAAVGLLEALEAYSMDGTEPEDIDPVAEIIFEGMRKELDIDREKYDRMVQQRKDAIAERWRREKDTKEYDRINSNTDSRQKTEDSRQETEYIDSEKSVEQSSPPVASFLLNDGTEFEVTQEVFNTLANTYPAVDTMQQLKQIAAWSFANPKYRKTRKGALRFINAWFARQQDKGLIPKEVARSGTDTKKMTAEEIMAIPAINPWRTAT